MLVAAPTGAGKTIVGEFAVYLALQRGRKCFYTTPIKALSNQKYADLVRRYGPQQVGLLTGDSSINSEAPVVVMTTEVLRNMIYADSRTLANLGFVVMDEVHYLADRFRGAVWEEVIIGLAESIQLVALSATVSNAEEFGDWLSEVRGEMAVVVSERRPVPLFQHVLVGRKLYDLFAGDAPTAIALPGGTKAEVNPALIQVAKDETRYVRDDSRRPRGRSGQGKRQVSVRQRERTAARRTGPATTTGGGPVRSTAFARIREPPGPGRDPGRRRAAAGDRVHLLPGRLRRRGPAGGSSPIRLTSAEEQEQITAIAERHVAGLSAADLRALDYAGFVEALTRGVAAHHAGMLPAFKECVEEAFVRGLIKVVFATETLALGINMPARSVVLEKLVKYNGETHADITPGEYTQLTGRAGRRGIDVEGHAVVLWQPGLDPRAVAGLASRRTYPLRSSFAPTYNMAVNLVGRVGRERARTLLEQSFAQFQSDRSVVGSARSLARNSEAIADNWRAAACDRGDFEAYARLRAEIGAVEAQAARERRSDRRAEAVQRLLDLRPGDIVRVPAGKHTGWAVVIDPDTRTGDRDNPRPLVLTEDRQVRRLSPVDFPTPPRGGGPDADPQALPPQGHGVAPQSRRRVAVPAGRAGSRRRPRPARTGKRGAGRADRRSLRDELRAASLPHLSGPGAPRPVGREGAAAGAGERAGPAAGGLADEHHRDPVRQDLPGARLARLSDGRRARRDAGERRRPDAGPDLRRAGPRRRRVHPRRRVRRTRLRPSWPPCWPRWSTRRGAPTTATGSRGCPTPSSEAAMTQVRRIWREVSLVERDARLPRGPEPDIGFSKPAFGWAAGQPLAVVLADSDLTAGDFVRWVRQVIDFAGQVADAAGPGQLREVARDVVVRMRRGVVAYSPDEDA